MQCVWCAHPQVHHTDMQQYCMQTYAICSCTEVPLSGLSMTLFGMNLRTKFVQVATEVCLGPWSSLPHHVGHTTVTLQCEATVLCFAVEPAQ